MALDYSFQISAKIETEILEEYLGAKVVSFNKETLNTDVFIYASEYLGYVIYLSYAENREITYNENGADQSFYSQGISTKFTIRLNKFYDHNQINLEVYDLVVFLIKKDTNNCILRYLDEYMIFIRVNNKFIYGDFVEETLFKDIDKKI